MLTQQSRPQTFKEVAGQELVKEVLKSIIRNPDKSPRSIIIQGAYGTGKTTQARIFAKAVNCPNSKNQEPCNRPDCPVCSQDLDNSSFYTEYDSSIIGNVDTIKELRDTFYYNKKGQYKVVVFDECHLASGKAQSALLKSIEEAPSGIFFIFATTHVNKILPTIRSRSLELQVTKVSVTDIVNNLRSVASKFNIEVDEQTLKIIAHKSNGHMRNAHMLLDLYSMLGKDKFIESVKTSKEHILNYLVATYQKDKNKLFKSIEALQTYPVADIYTDFNEVILEVTKCLVEPRDTPEGKIAKLYGINFIKLVKQFSSEWVQTSFTNEVSFQACLLALYQLFTANNQSSRVVRTK